jgi:hypothetical protein
VTGGSVRPEGAGSGRKGPGAPGAVSAGSGKAGSGHKRRRWRRSAQGVGGGGGGDDGRLRARVAAPRSGGGGGRLRAWVAAPEGGDDRLGAWVAAPGRFKTRRGREGKRSAGGFEAQVYSTVPRLICRVYSSITIEYMWQVRRLINEYMWQGHVSRAHDMFVG